MDPRACGGGHCFKVFPKFFPGHLIKRVVVPIFGSEKNKFDQIFNRYSWIVFFLPKKRNAYSDGRKYN